MMKRNGIGPAAIVAGALAALAGCGDGTPRAVETTEVTPGEWTPLFDGESLEGWRSYAEDGALNPQWIVEDGAIVLDVDEDTDETTGGDLITVDQYENFELELEWKISEGGNSGIFFGVREIPGHQVAYESGIEMQVLDDDKHVDGRTPETSAGACYALYAPEGKVLRPVGEYNKVRLLVDDGRVEHWLNGKKIVEYVIGSDDWNERIANSKFSDWEHFAQYRKGHIGLQDHSDRVWFRNIRIRTP
jgi:hypothetical protein